MTLAAKLINLADMTAPSAANASLHGRSFVVTRPAGESHALATRLRRLGARVCALAPFRLIACGDRDALQAALIQAESADVLVFASVYAVRHTFAARPAFKPQGRVLAQGPATAKALAQHAIAAELPAAGYRSEDVLVHPWLAEAKHVVRMTGAGGRDWLVKQLISRGVDARDLPVYARDALTPRPDTLARIDALTHPHLIVSSREALLALPALLGGARWLRLAAAPIFVSSERLAVLARTMHCARVHVAASARSNDLLTAVCAWR